MADPAGVEGREDGQSANWELGANEKAVAHGCVHRLAGMTHIGQGGISGLVPEFSDLVPVLTFRTIGLIKKARVCRHQLPHTLLNQNKSSLKFKDGQMRMVLFLFNPHPFPIPQSCVEGISR